MSAAPSGGYQFFLCNSWGSRPRLSICRASGAIEHLLLTCGAAVPAAHRRWRWNCAGRDARTTKPPCGNQRPKPVETRSGDRSLAWGLRAPGTGIQINERAPGGGDRSKARGTNSKLIIHRPSTALIARKRAPPALADPYVVGAGFTPARAKTIPCISASKQRTLYEMMWLGSRPRSVTPDSGGDKPLPYKVFNLQRKEIRVDRGGGG